MVFNCTNRNAKLFADCGVRPCHQKKEVDFCFQCEEFPCENTHFDGNLHKRWIELNNKIREKGVESYYLESKDKPRY